MVEAYKPIRTLVLGDHSRYQFLREIIPSSSWEEIWHKRKSGLLTQMLLQVEEKKSAGDGAIYFGEDRICLKGVLPLGTTLLYPPEGKELKEKLLFSDRILFFDEFPFRERALLEKMRRHASLYPLHPLAVVLYHPERRQLTTDITTVESAAREAKRMYELEHIRAELHVPGSPPDFLYWRRAEVYAERRRALKEAPEAVGENMEKYGPFELELLLLDLNFLVDVNELERCIKYGPDLAGRNLHEVYADRFLKAHLCEGSAGFRKAVLAYYRYFMKPLCIWPEEADENALMKLLTTYWENYKVGRKAAIFPAGDQMEYHGFLLETRAGFQFKTEVSQFINKELPGLLKAYMERNIRLYEEIMHE